MGASPEQLSLALDDPAEDERIEKLEARREEVLLAVNSAKLDTIQRRVAWILNHYPEARDSDITLQLRYWRHFEKDFNGEYIRVDDLYRFARLPSLWRARAKIQNDFKLFVASLEVRRQRGTLDDAERERAAEQRPAYPLFAVYADESGKTDDNLVVGSVWFLHSPETATLVTDLKEWRLRRSFEEEFHFKTITKARLPLYKELADLVAARSDTISFKAISIPRTGVGNVRDAFVELYYHLLVHGAQHEDDSGRGPLPRRLQLCKDAEEAGYDSMLLSSVKDRLAQAGQTLFAGRLEPDEFEALPSSELDLVQIADLFTSSVSRVLNAKGERSGHKDEFADYFLTAVRMPGGPTDVLQDSDVVYHVGL